MPRRALPLLALIAGLAAAAACGKKGPVQAPLVRLPQAVQDFKAFQRGGAFRLEWKLPPAYIDGMPFTKPVEVEVWLVEEELPARPAPTAPEPAAKAPEGEKRDEAAPVEKPATEEIAADTKPAAPENVQKPEPAAEQEAAPQASAAPVPAGAQAQAPPAAQPSTLFPSGEMPLELFEEKAVLAGGVPAAFGEAQPEAQGDGLVAQSYEKPVDPARLNFSSTFAVRVRDHRKKLSDYSSRITVVPRVPPGPPRNVRLTLHEDKIALSWEAPAPGPEPAAPAGYHVYRARATDPPQSLTEAGPVRGTGFEDKTFAFGEVYLYTVRAVVGDSAPFLESADSDALEAKPVDTFPPAPPSGLKTVAGPGFISLSWEEGPEPDLAGYRVWRKPAAEGEFEPLTEAALRETNFVDRAVQAGKRYAYAVSALDKVGNESRRTKPANETARSPLP